MRTFFYHKLIRLVKDNKYLLFLITLLIGMSLVLYRNYVFGGKLFLFEDFGSDSVRVSLPSYIFLFDWFKSGMPFWSDKLGIGTSILSHGDIIFDPFTYILFLFGRSNIIYMFVYMVITKIVLAGAFFWLFLGKYSKYKLSFYPKIIGALTYAFGGYMIVTGQNYVFSTIYVFLPLIMLGFEIWLQDKKKLFLILMLTLTALYFYYFFYMTAIFFASYAIFRYFIFYKFKLKHFLTYLSSLALYGLTAIGLSAFYWLPSLVLTFGNLRVGLSFPSITQMFLPNIIIGERLPAILTALGRLFGYNVFGIGSFVSYSGYKGDYFQLALFVGIITILLVPQLFTQLKNKEKKIYLFFSLLLLIFLLVPFFSYVFNGFSDFTYRWTYILHFSLALFLAIAINNVFENKKLNYKILFVTLASLIVISILVITSIVLVNIKNPVSFLGTTKLFFKDYMLIAVYSLLTVLFMNTNYKKYIKILILILVCVELVWFPANFINNRITTSPDPVKFKLGFFDNSNKAIDYIKSVDSSIYRVDKSYESVISEYGTTPSDSDAMVQNYRGLKSYNSNNQPNYIRFLQYSGIFVKYPSYLPPKSIKPQDIKDDNLNYINGVGDRYLLQSFLGVKYYLTKRNDDIKLPDYYHYLTTIRDINIYKNDYYLPLGMTFDSYTNGQFMKLNNSQKDLALLSSAVVENSNNFLEINKSEASFDKDLYELINERRNEAFKIRSYKDDGIEGVIQVSKNKVLVFTIPYDKGWTVFVDGAKTIPFKVDNGLIGIKLPTGKHLIELRYFPPGLVAGTIISVVTLLMLIIFTFYRKDFKDIIGNFRAFRL